MRQELPVLAVGDEDAQTIGGLRADRLAIDHLQSGDRIGNDQQIRITGYLEIRERVVAELQLM